MFGQWRRSPDARKDRHFAGHHNDNRFYYVDDRRGHDNHLDYEQHHRAD
jgi:hypothetical protein